MLHCRNRTKTIPLGNIQPLLEKVSGTLVFCRSTCMTEVTAIIETSYVFRHFWPLNNLHMSFVTTTSSLCFSPPLTCLATKWLLRVFRYNAYSHDCIYISSLIVEDSINLDANSDPLSAAVTLLNLFLISFMMVIPLQGSTSKGKCFTRFLFSFFFSREEVQ